MKDWKSSIGRNTYTIVLFYFLKGRWQGDSENNNTDQVRKKEEGHQCRRRCNKFILKLPKVKLEFAKQSFYYSGAKKSIMICQLTYSLSFWKRREAMLTCLFLVRSDEPRVLIYNRVDVRGHKYVLDRLRLIG